MKFFKKTWAVLCKKFDKAFYKGGWRQFLWLFVILFVFVLLGLWMAASYNVNCWRVIELMLDPGSFCDSFKNGGSVWFQLIVTLVGAVVFTSLLINAIGNFIDRRVDRYRNGGIAYDVDDHILILGSGSMAVNLIKTLLQDERNVKRDIVIMTSNDAEELRAYVLSEIPKEKSKNIYVYYGSRVRKETLNKLDAFQTTAIYIIGEDNEPAHDSVNMKCYEILKNVCSCSEKVIKCYLVLEHMTSMQLFYYKQDSASTDKLHLTVINSLENIAQRVLVSRYYKEGVKYPALDRDGIGVNDDKYVHLVIVGMSQMGYAMAVTAAHVCHFPNFVSKGKRTKITFVQSDIRQEMDFFIGRYNDLMKLSYWKYVNFDSPELCMESAPDKEYVDTSVDSKGFLDIEWEFIDGGIETENVRTYIKQCVTDSDESELLTIALCNEEAETNASSALFLPDTVYENHIPVFVYQPGGDQMIKIIRDSSLYMDIYPFGMKSDSMDKQYLDRVKRARRIKYLYDMEDKYIKMPSDDELQEKWFCTQYAFQQSNTYAANSIPFKMRSIGNYTRRKLTNDEIDILSVVEHNRWNVERLLMGFKPYSVKDRKFFISVLTSDDEVKKKELSDKLKKKKVECFKHKDIAPYDELLPDSKAYDKLIVRNIIDVLGDENE